MKLIQPYTCVRLPFISSALHIPEADVEQLLVSLILDNRITGHVDQVGDSGGLLEPQDCFDTLASSSSASVQLQHAR